MSKVLINQYYNNLDRVLKFGKSTNETSVRNQFWTLLNEYARKMNYEVIPELSCMGTKGKKVTPDGIVKNLFGLDIGLWESKDEKDTIDDEIDSKLKKGYPFTNILFEDTVTAVLFQRDEEVARVPVRDADKLNDILNQFISFKSETIFKFEDAMEKFKADIPIIVETLRHRIDDSSRKNINFHEANSLFLTLCKAEINPEITDADIREMMIQHILTADIFNKIFDDPDFHRHNNIARELGKLIEILFTFSELKNLMSSIEHYYDAINAAASGITDHHEKQKFLKVLYENFYKVYNPKAADRLGVVYTPNEIVQFMIESTDYLLHKHFGKTLADKNVDILDPATGTATYITSLIDHIPSQHLAYKYKNEIHANEVSILPYYIANLNIEFTFKQKMGYYEEYKNLCFVDTLDNTDANVYDDQQHSLAFGLSSENSERIKKQNSKKISVIIGNPPYNANQANENDNNKNREYPAIDKRIKETYIKESTAQKTKVYDMYARFYRWASDRLDKNGVLAFITNRSFIDSRTFDGFRKIISNEFNECFIVDTKSDVRANPKIAGTTHNVFGIQTGVSVMFLVKKETQEGKCKIFYTNMEDEWRKEEKLDWFRNNRLHNISFENIIPDKNNNWINLADNDFEDLLPLASKEVKFGKSENALFQLFSLGVVTNRDDWVYDYNKKNLENKVKLFCRVYTSEKSRWNKSNKSIPINDFVDRTIKWTEELENHLIRGNELNFNTNRIIESTYRPFVKMNFYFDRIITHRIYQNFALFGEDARKNNIGIGYIGMDTQKPFSILAFNRLVGLNYISPASGCQCLPLYRYAETGERIDNITDWGLEQFKNHYQSVIASSPSGEAKQSKKLSIKEKQITKEDIFNYVYGVLHNPAYRKKYELNLKREFPRIPFYKNFWQWADWGKKLMDLHINYETIKPFPLKRFDEELEENSKGIKAKIKVKLKADKDFGKIVIDDRTTLSGVPKEAWNYKLGNRSALEWILDQYKEKKPKDPTIAEKFNTYRFADYKEEVIDLLKKVCTVSVETMKIISEMEKE